MPDTFTTNLNLTKPEVGASTDTWGTKLNTDLDTLDALFAAAGSGTSVGLNVGSGKTLTVSGTLNVTGTLSGGIIAPRASPTFTGTPAAPTAAVDTNTTQIATTAYVVGQGYLKSATASSTYAPINSPTFTGSVTIPGGAINNAAIGGTTPSTGAFTTLSASGTATFSGAMSATAAAYMQIDTLTDGATITPDFSVGNNFSVTLGGNRTLANPTNLTAGQSGVIFITQDGTGSRTLAYGSSWDFPNATAPTLTTTANAVDVLVYTVRSSTSIAAQLITNIG